MSFFGTLRTWHGDLSPEQLEQMRLLIITFQRAWPSKDGETAPKLPVEFTYAKDQEEKKPAFMPEVTSHQQGSWLPLLGHSATSQGSLRLWAELIINKTCAYEAQRTSRGFFQSGNPQEPIRLLGHFLREKIVEISKSAVNEDLLTEIRSLLDFVRVLLNSGCFAPEHKACREEPSMLSDDKVTLTIESALLETEFALTNMENIVEKEIASRSAGDNIKELLTCTRNATHHALAYLFYAVNNMEEAPTDFSIEYLINPQREAYSNWLTKTVAGRQLNALACSVAPAVVAPVQGDIKADKISYSSDNCFYDQDGALILPREVKVKTVQAFLDKAVKPGVEQKFLTTEFLTCFMQFHAAINDLANITSVWLAAFSLAGKGGDLLLYGLAGAELKRTIESNFTVVQEARKALQQISLAANQYLRSIAGGHVDAAANWKANSRIAQVYLPELKKDFDRINKLLSNIHEAATRLTLPEIEAEARRALNDFNTTAKLYADALERRHQQHGKAVQALSHLTITEVTGGARLALPLLVDEDSGAATAPPVSSVAQLVAVSSPLMHSTSQASATVTAHDVATVTPIKVTIPGATTPTALRQ